jgi:streptomycin 6-kinase
VETGSRRENALKQKNSLVEQARDPGLTGAGLSRTRGRGHSRLSGALDAQILWERAEGNLASTSTLQKLKDDASDVLMLARLETPSAAGRSANTRQSEQFSRGAGAHLENVGLMLI